MATTDAIPLERWTVGRDAEAFQELVGRHASMVFATARRILGDRAQAEDVAQDCILRLVEAPRKAPALPGRLHRVAKNRSLDILRSERRPREHEARWSPPGGPAAVSSQEDVEALMDDAIDGLPDELRYRGAPETRSAGLLADAPPATSGCWTSRAACPSSPGQHEDQAREPRARGGQVLRWSDDGGERGHLPRGRREVRRASEANVPADPPKVSGLLCAVRAQCHR